MTLLKNLLDSSDPYISVFNVFKIIKEKTELKSDQEIADLLITIKINEVSTPFDKFRYFDGKPEILHRDCQQKLLSKMDLLLLEIARGEVSLNGNDQRLKSFVWDKSSFFYDFEDITKISLEDYEQQDDEFHLNPEQANIDSRLYITDILKEKKDEYCPLIYLIEDFSHTFDLKISELSTLLLIHKFEECAKAFINLNKFEYVSLSQEDSTKAIHYILNMMSDKKFSSTSIELNINEELFEFSHIYIRKNDLYSFEYLKEITVNICSGYTKFGEAKFGDIDLQQLHSALDEYRSKQPKPFSDEWYDSHPKLKGPHIGANEFRQPLKDQQDDNIGNPSIGHASLEHYQQQRDKLLKENEILKELLTNFENEKIQFQETKNATLNAESCLLNSDLILLSALLNMLQNEIKVKANKSQAKILQKIEDEHKGIKGLSKSRTEKIIAEANRIYKPLIKNRMK